MSKRGLAVSVVCLLGAMIAGCARWEVTKPARSAMEQRLIGAAADRAAKRLAQLVEPRLGKVFLDATLLEGTDKAYALHAVRRELLARGIPLVDAKGQADTIVEVSAGALSIDQSNSMIGIPAFQVPVPLAGQVGLPETALFKKITYRGVAILSLSARERKSGKPIGKGLVHRGTAYNNQWKILFIFSFSTSNLPDFPDEPDESD